MFDVVVVGGGLAGTSCALALTAHGLTVGLSRGGWGASANFAGQLQLGASPALVHKAPRPWGEAQDPAAEVARAPWASHVRDLVGHEPLHPYALLGSHATTRGLARALAALAPVWQDCGVAIDAQVLQAAPQAWPSASGALVPCYSQHSPWAGAGGPAGSWVAVDFVHAGVRMGPRAVMGWRHDAARWGLSLGDGRVVQVPPERLRHNGRALEGALALARAFDDEAFVRAVGQTLAPALAGAEVALLPAVLGLRHHRRARQILAAQWKCAVVEALADAPYLPGIRLMQALEAQAQAARVALLAPIAKVRRTPGQKTRLQLADGQQLSPNACVVATGRFVGGGLQWPATGRCHEPLWKLPVITDGGPLIERSALELTRRRPEEQQPLARAGLATDAQLRPYDADGVAVPDLWAAGTVLGGYSPQSTACSDGVALATAQAAADAIHRAIAGPVAPQGGQP